MNQTIKVRGGASGQIVSAVLVTAGITVATILTIKGLQALNIIPSKYDRKLRKYKGLNPDFYKDHLNKTTISTSKADQIAYEIKMSYGFATAANTSDLGGWNPFKVLIDTVGVGVSIGTGEYNYGNDNEKRLFNAISQAGSSYNLSKVSDVFEKKYGENMYEYMLSFMNNADSEVIYNIVKNYNN